MANVASPQGLLFSRNKISGANTYQAMQRYIVRGLGTAIGLGDLVSSTAGGGVQASTTSPFLGVFAGILPYYDQTLQAIAHGLNGSYVATANPPTGVNIQCLVISDPFVVFRAQVTDGTTFTQAWIGQNINIVSGTNGVPNAAGISTLALAGASVATTNTLPFRIEGLAGVVGGPQDPTQANPWLEVSLNPGVSELLASLGV